MSSFVEGEPEPHADRAVVAAKPGASSSSTVVLGLAALVLLAGVGAGAFLRQPLVKPPVTPPPAVVALAPPPAQPKAPAPPALDLYADAVPFQRELERKLGSGLWVQSIVIYRPYASADVRDPQKPNNIDRYFLNNGEFNPPSPVTQSVSDDKLPETLFLLADFDFTLVPKLVQIALHEIPVENAAVTHMIVDREPRRKPRINVYVSNERSRGGRVEFAIDGTKRRVFK